MGMSHNNPKTYPRLGSMLGYAPLADCIAIAEAVVTTQRDYGDRTNRKHARMKYTVDDKGMEWFRSQVEARSGVTLEPARPFAFTSNGDRYGWVRGGVAPPGAPPLTTWGYGLFIQNGRIKDSGAYKLKTCLAAVARALAGTGAEFRLSPNQNLCIARIPHAAKAGVEALLELHGVAGNGAQSGLRLNAMACVAMPTCGLALAESERYLPDLITRLEGALEVAGLRDDAITIRMTGCPNGCARPYVAEIGLVGRSPGVYNLYLGGGFHGERLSKLWREDADEEAVVAALAPAFKRYAVERANGEHFGDWAIRAGLVKATREGRDFHEQ